jgi:hypothetical protein
MYRAFGYQISNKVNERSTQCPLVPSTRSHARGADVLRGPPTASNLYTAVRIVFGLTCDSSLQFGDKLQRGIVAATVAKFTET